MTKTTIQAADVVIIDLSTLGHPKHNGVIEEIAASMREAAEGILPGICYDPDGHRLIVCCLLHSDAEMISHDWESVLEVWEARHGQEN